MKRASYKLGVILNTNIKEKKICKEIKAIIYVFSIKINKLVNNDENTIKLNRIKVFKILEKAFNINYEAHLSRNRVKEATLINSILGKYNDKKNYYKVEKLYDEKIQHLRHAIRFLENNNTDIIYGLKDDILFFQHKKIMITFHVHGKVKTKQINIIWDGQTHNIFPFNY